MEIESIVIDEESFDQLIAETTPDPVHVCKEYILANEAKGIAEKRLKTLKPLVVGLETGKETFFDGKFRGKMGQYKINHVTASQPFASVKVLEEWLQRGKISQADFEEAVKVADKSYPLVTWKAGTGK
jgi:hypothetical protein